MSEREVVITTWIRGNLHSISLVRRGRSHTVQVDGGEPVTVPSHSGGYLISCEDFPLKIGGVEHILVLRGNGARLVKNGRYVDSGEEYVPAVRAPRWIWAFALLHMAIVPQAFYYATRISTQGGYLTDILLASLGGGLAFLLAFAGYSACESAVCTGRIFKKPVHSTSARLGVCLMVTAVAWFVWAGWCTLITVI